MVEKDVKIQVNKGHYTTHRYNTLGRFISYYYQFRSILGCKPETVLEIGMGSGVVKNLLKDGGVRVETADIDPDVKPDLVVDVRDFSIENEYDVVAAFQILEHIPFEEFDGALKNLAKASKRHVVISLPSKSTVFEFVFKFPFIRTLFKKDFINPYVRVPLKFHGFKKSGQHYWEIDNRAFSYNRVKKVIEKRFKVLEEFSPVLNKYHRFFVLEKKD